MQILESISRRVIAEKIKNKDSEILIEIVDSLISRGAERVVIGCTELPLVFPRKYKMPVYSSVEILAMALLRKYYA